MAPYLEPACNHFIRSASSEERARSQSLYSVLCSTVYVEFLKTLLTRPRCVAVIRVIAFCYVCVAPNRTFFLCRAWSELLRVHGHGPVPRRLMHSAPRSLPQTQWHVLHSGHRLRRGRYWTFILFTNIKRHFVWAAKTRRFQPVVVNSF